jgi:hypothetical protein
MSTDVAIPADGNVIIKVAEKIINSSHVDCDSRGDIGNNMGDWNSFKITQTVPEKHTGKGRN